MFHNSFVNISLVFLTFWSSNGLAAEKELTHEKQKLEMSKETGLARQKGSWIIAPLVSSGPKLGISAGLNISYLKSFDEVSPVSAFGINGTYSDTKSWTALAYGSTFWDQNNSRIFSIIGAGEIFNYYEDYLGTGPQSIETDFYVGYLDYQRRLGESNWFIGGNYVYTNGNPSSTSYLTTLIMALAKASNTTSSGLGLHISYDTAQNSMNPRTGRSFNYMSIAFMEAIGSDKDYWYHLIEYSKYFTLAEKNILAYNIHTLVTRGAPTIAKASFGNFRAYTQGEILANNTSWIQVEYRRLLGERWELAAFTGISTLYDDIDSFTDTDNLYPMGGIGGRFILDVEKSAVLRLDYAVGTGVHEAVYLQLGQAF